MFVKTLPQLTPAFLIVLSLGSQLQLLGLQGWQSPGEAVLQAPGGSGHVPQFLSCSHLSSGMCRPPETVKASLGLKVPKVQFLYPHTGFLTGRNLSCDSPWSAKVTLASV